MLDLQRSSTACAERAWEGSWHSLLPLHIYSLAQITPVEVLPYPTRIALSLLKWRMQLIHSILLGCWSCLEGWVKRSWSKLHQPKPKELPHSSPACRAGATLQRHIPSISLTFSTPSSLGPLSEGVKTSHQISIRGFQRFAVTKQTPVRLRCGTGSGKVSGCRAGCIIGLIYSYQHGTWFESSITVTSHSGVCMLQRASKLERNLPPAAEHYITINRKQAESSRRSPSLAWTVMLMEMYTHSSICTYYGACQAVGLHCKKESRAERDKIWQRASKLHSAHWDFHINVRVWGLGCLNLTCSKMGHKGLEVYVTLHSAKCCFSSTEITALPSPICLFPALLPRQQLHLH